MNVQKQIQKQIILPSVSFINTKKTFKQPVVVNLGAVKNENLTNNWKKAKALFELSGGGSQVVIVITFYPTIRVRIPLKPTVFLYNLVFEKRKRGRSWHPFKQIIGSAVDIVTLQHQSNGYFGRANINKQQQRQEIQVQDHGVLYIKRSHWLARYFAIQQKAGLFYIIKSKRLPLKSNLFFVDWGQLSCKPVTPLYLKTSMSR